MTQTSPVTPWLLLDPGSGQHGWRLPNLSLQNTAKNCLPVLLLLLVDAQAACMARHG
jgi:hypothetical protein